MSVPHVVESDHTNPCGCNLAIFARWCDNQKAAGGVDGSGDLNTRECAHHHAKWTCGLCAEAANHGSKSSGGPRWSARLAKIGKKKGLRFKERYEAATVAKKQLMLGGPHGRQTVDLD